jgi:hypothetical protein
VKKSELSLLLLIAHVSSSFSLPAQFHSPKDVPGTKFYDLIPECEYEKTMDSKRGLEEASETATNQEMPTEPFRADPRAHYLFILICLFVCLSPGLGFREMIVADAAIIAISLFIQMGAHERKSVAQSRQFLLQEKR